MDLTCLKISAPINDACETELINDFYRIATILPYDEVDEDSIVVDGCSVKFDLKAKGGGVLIKDPSNMPFNGTGTTSEDKSRLVYNQSVMLPIIEKTPENTKILDDLVNSFKRVVVILKHTNYNADGTNAYVVYGHETGLYVKPDSTKDELSAYHLTLASNLVGKPDYFFFDTDLATTVAKVESFQDYYIMQVNLVEDTFVLAVTPNIRDIYLKLANGEIIESVDGEITIAPITEAQVGNAIIYIQKSSENGAVTGLGGDAFSGFLSYSGSSISLGNMGACTGIGVELATRINIQSGCDSIVDIKVKEAESIIIYNETLPSSSVEKIADALVKRGKLDGEITLTTTETLSANCERLLDILSNRGWTITTP